MSSMLGSDTLALTDHSDCALEEHEDGHDLRAAAEDGRGDLGNVHRQRRSARRLSRQCVCAFDRGGSGSASHWNQQHGDVVGKHGLFAAARNGHGSGGPLHHRDPQRRIGCFGSGPGRWRGDNHGRDGGDRSHGRRRWRLQYGLLGFCGCPSGVITLDLKAFPVEQGCRAGRKARDISQASTPCRANVRSLPAKGEVE